MHLLQLCCKAPPAAAEKSVPPDHGLVGRYARGPFVSLYVNIGWWKWNFLAHLLQNGHGFSDVFSRYHEPNATLTSMSCDQFMNL